MALKDAPAGKGNDSFIDSGKDAKGIPPADYTKIADTEDSPVITMTESEEDEL